MTAALVTVHLSADATLGRHVWEVLTGPGLRERGVVPSDDRDGGGAAPVLLGVRLGATADLEAGPVLLPGAEAALASLGLDAGLRVVLDVRRQDHLLEQANADLVRAGGATELADQFPGAATTVLDWAQVATRVAGCPGVSEVVLRPVEAFREDPAALAQNLLRIAGVGAVATQPLRSERGFGARGIVVERAMNRFLESDHERELVRDFVDRLFPDAARDNRILDTEQRAAVLAVNAEANRKMFRTWLPALPEDGYLTDEGTSALSAPPKRESGS